MGRLNLEGKKIFKCAKTIKDGKLNKHIFFPLPHIHTHEAFGALIPARKQSA